MDNLKENENPPTYNTPKGLRTSNREKMISPKVCLLRTSKFEYGTEFDTPEHEPLYSDNPDYIETVNHTMNTTSNTTSNKVSNKVSNKISNKVSNKVTNTTVFKKSKTFLTKQNLRRNQTCPETTQVNKSPSNKNNNNISGRTTQISRRISHNDFGQKLPPKFATLVKVMMEEKTVEMTENNIDFNRARNRLGKKLGHLVQRRKTHDVALISALIGMVLAIIDAEPCIVKTESQSVCLRLGVSISTFCCITAICHYYFHEWKIFKLDNSVASWQSFGFSSYFPMLIVELAVVAVHPVPLELLSLFVKCEKLVDSDEKMTNNSYTEDSPFNYTFKNTSISPVFVECDPENFKLEYNVYTTLVILMLGRIFIILRGIILHQRFFNSPRVQLLGALNQINCGTLCRENICYICRHIMASSSGKVILCLITSCFNTFAWVVFIAEHYHSVHAAQANAENNDENFKPLKISTIKTHFESNYSR